MTKFTSRATVKDFRVGDVVRFQEPAFPSLNNRYGKMTVTRLTSRYVYFYSEKESREVSNIPDYMELLERGYKVDDWCID